MFVGMLHFAAPPIVGGVEAVIARHATALVQHGHQVEILAGRGDTFHPQISVRQIPLLDSQSPEITALKVHLDAGIYPRDQFDAIVQQLHTALMPHLHKYDAIIVHNALTMTQNLPLTALLHRLAEQGQLPHMIGWHHDMAWNLPRYQSQLHTGYPWDLLRTPTPDTIHVTVSQNRKEALMELMELSPEEVHAVPGGVDIAAYWGMTGRIRKLVNKMNILNAEPTLLLPARLTRRKNIEFAIRVIGELREYYDRPLLIVTGPTDPHNSGDAAYFADLRKLVADLQLEGNVWLLAEHLDNPPQDEEVMMLYRAADAMILPSKSEGFGLPMLEAAIVRLPIFCTDIPPLRETGGEEANYFALDATAQDVAALIYRRLTNDRAMKIRRRVMQRYAWNHIVEQQLMPLLEEQDTVQEYAVS